MKPPGTRKAPRRVRPEPDPDEGPYVLRRTPLGRLGNQEDERMTPGEAQAAYVAADDKFLAHKRACDACGNSRVRHQRPCPDGDPLRAAALAGRRAWADAVALARAAERGA